MTSFKVAPQDLDGYAALLARAAGDAQECKSYLDRHVPDLQPVADGIINPLVYEHARVRAQLTAMLGHLTTLLDASQEAMRAAAAQYRSSDDASAARLDDSYPTVQRPSMRAH